MPHLVMGHDLALARVEHAVLFLETGDDALDGIVEIVHRHRLGLPPCGEQGGFVHQIGEVGPGKPGVSAATFSASTSGASFTFFM